MSAPVICEAGGDGVDVAGQVVGSAVLVRVVPKVPNDRVSQSDYALAKNIWNSLIELLVDTDAIFGDCRK